jgi:hypothetical protein
MPPALIIITSLMDDQPCLAGLLPTPCDCCPINVEPGDGTNRVRDHSSSAISICHPLFFFCCCCCCCRCCCAAAPSELCGATVPCCPSPHLSPSGVIACDCMEQRRSQLNDGYDAVHWAANYDDEAALSACLSSDPARAALVTARGMTPLHICALNNSVQCARALLLLLPAGAIDAVNCWGETALHLACACDASEVRAVLLQAGADALARDAWGRTPSEAAAAYHAGQLGSVAQPPSPPHPPQLPPLLAPSSIDAASFNHELLSAISSRRLRSIPPPLVRGIFSDVLPPPAAAAAAPPSSRPPRRPLSSLVEYPGDPDRVRSLLQDSAVDAAGADSFGLTGVPAVCRCRLCTHCSHFTQQFTNLRRGTNASCCGCCWRTLIRLSPPPP